MIALALMCLLFFSELSWFMTTETTNHLRVDPSRGEKLKINFDVTFPHISCSCTRMPTDSKHLISSVRNDEIRLDPSTLRLSRECFPRLFLISCFAMQCLPLT